MSDASRLATASSENRPGQRIRIGLLVDQFSNEYIETVVSEVVAAAAAHGAETVSIAGGALRAADVESPHRWPFDLATTSSVDALIVLPLGGEVGPEEMAVFCRRYRPLPICSIAVPWVDYPAVLVDNETGLRDGILHLIRAHGRRRLAFVTGPAHNSDAALRFDVYRDALAEGGLVFDPQLVVPGTFEVEGAVRAVRTLLDERWANFDAVVCANDASAFGAIQEFRRRRISVPERVAILGFDDLQMSRYLDPALTTIGQPLREQAQLAVRTVLRELRGEARPWRTVLPAQLVLRESCGCAVYEAPRRGPGTLGGASESDDLARMRLDVEATVGTLRGVGALNASDPDWAERLHEALVRNVAGEDVSFIRELAALARRVSRAEGDAGELHKVITALAVSAQSHLRGGALRRADALLQAARVKLNSVVGRVPVQRLQRAQAHMWELLQTNQALALAMDLPSVRAAVAHQIGTFGIRAVHACTYEADADPSENGVLNKQSRWILGHDSERQLPISAEGRQFPTAQLLPAEALRSEGGGSYLVCPLDLGDGASGYVVFDGWMGHANVYEGLAGQLSAAIGKLRLLERLVREAELREIADRRRLEGELRIAAEIQMGSLPDQVSVEGLEIAATMRPLMEVGGDYYDVIPTSGGCWLGIGDVTGHGLPAGLAMRIIQTVVRGVIRRNPDIAPGEVFAVVNAVFYENVRVRMQREELSTLSLIRYESSGSLSCAGAHEVIAICRAADGTIEIVETPGTWVGLVPDVRGLTADRSFELRAGDLMLLFTDGLTEARNAAGEMFGLDRATGALAQARHGSVQAVLDALLSAVGQWTATPQDDMSIVVVRRLGA